MNLTPKKRINNKTFRWHFFCKRTIKSNKQMFSLSQKWQLLSAKVPIRFIKDYPFNFPGGQLWLVLLKCEMWLKIIWFPSLLSSQPYNTNVLQHVIKRQRMAINELWLTVHCFPITHIKAHTKNDLFNHNWVNVIP